MTNETIPLKALTSLSSARMEALLLSRKMWNVRDELESFLETPDNREDPMYRDMKSLYEDADHIVKLLGNMDDRFLYIQQNHERLKLRSEHGDISRVVV
jgi:hypothetical protein